MEENMFSLYESKGTNESLIITFTPGADIKKYEIILYKDNVEYKKEVINQNKQTSVLLDSSGIYKIEVNLFDSNDKISQVKSGEYIIDKEAPVIELTKKVITIKQGKSFNQNDFIIVKDNMDVNPRIESNYNSLDLYKIGAQIITYEVYDGSGNKASKTVIVNVKKNNDNILMVYQGLLGIIIILLAIFVIWFKRKQRIFERVSKYSVQGIKQTSEGVMDYFINIYMNILRFVVKILNNSGIAKKQGQKYNKYVSLSTLKVKNGITLVAHKIVFGFLFVIICAFSKAILGDVITVEEGLLLYLIGYFLPDIKYLILYRKYHDKLEEDLLESVVIMNNAFKVGASPEQAIKIVGEEMNGTMQKEYKQIYAEIKFGLSINDAFARFSERLNLKEAEYVAASLEILNETGGDVVKIFDSIEKNLFNTRKIKNEYKALTGSPKLISNFLFVLPIIFVIIILMINNEYFNPLFKSSVGILLIVVAIALYIMYILIIRKILKIRM